MAAVKTEAEKITGTVAVCGTEAKPEDRRLSEYIKRQSLTGTIYGRTAVILLTFFLCLAVFAGMLLFGMKSVGEALTVIIATEEGTNEISLWEDEGRLYAFLPGGADTDSLGVDLKTPRKAYFDGERIEDGASLPPVSPGEIHTLTLGKKTEELVFMCSGHLPAMYINSVRGSVPQKKNDKTGVCITVADAAGNELYRGTAYQDTLSAHGNTALLIEKKSFNVTLSQPTEILGMGAAQKWILLANGYDETLIRNRLVFDLARKMGLGWTPRSEFIDLYVDSEYQGLYMLTERVEIGENRLSPGGSPCLYEVKNSLRWQNPENCFDTVGGRQFEMEYPERCTGEQLALFSERMQKIEDLIAAADSSDDVFAYIDEDSWACRYLIDVLTNNVDAEKYSSFYYWDSADETGKMYAGPVWDYDSALGNTNNEWSKLADVASAIPSKTLWGSMLMQNRQFRERTVTLYSEIMRPAVEELIDSGIDGILDELSASMAMNSVRWRGRLPEKLGSAETSAGEMKTFLGKRLELLDMLWISGDYAEIRVHPTSGGSYLFGMAPDKCGELLKDIERSLEKENIQWRTRTGEIFDPELTPENGTEIYEYSEPVVKAEEDTDNQWEYGRKRTVAAIAACAAFVIMAAALFYADIKMNSGGEKRRDRSKISS